MADYHPLDERYKAPKSDAKKDGKPWRTEGAKVSSFERNNFSKFEPADTKRTGALNARQPGLRVAPEEPLLSKFFGLLTRLYKWNKSRTNRREARRRRSSAAFSFIILVFLYMWFVDSKANTIADVNFGLGEPAEMNSVSLK